MPLPSSYSLRIEESKLAGYLLSQANSQGKASFFLGFGFRPDKWLVFSDALKAQALANPVVKTVASPYGTRYSVDGELETPSGRKPRVRTVWIHEEGSNELRLITAHPA